MLTTDSEAQIFALPSPHPSRRAAFIVYPASPGAREPAAPRYGRRRGGGGGGAGRGSIRLAASQSPGQAVKRLPRAARGMESSAPARRAGRKATPERLPHLPLAARRALGCGHRRRPCRHPSQRRGGRRRRRYGRRRSKSNSGKMRRVRGCDDMTPSKKPFFALEGEHRKMRRVRRCAMSRRRLVGGPREPRCGSRIA